MSRMFGCERARRESPAVFLQGREFIGLACLLFFLIFGAKPVFAQDLESFGKTDDPANANSQNGKHLYHSYGCYECHGGQGQGSPLSGPRVGPDPMNFPSFASYIRHPSGQMPPYTRKVTSDSELADIYAFLKSLPPPDVKKIPALAMPSAEKKR
jgi:mono/diheme cytochrome c family protein